MNNQVLIDSYCQSLIRWHCETLLCTASQHGGKDKQTALLGSVHLALPFRCVYAHHR